MASLGRTGVWLQMYSAADWACVYRSIIRFPGFWPGAKRVCPSLPYLSKVLEIKDLSLDFACRVLILQAARSQSLPNKGFRFGPRFLSENLVGIAPINSLAS